MISPLSSRSSGTSEAKRTFPLQAGALSIGVPLRKWAPGVAETLITVNAWTVLLEDVMRWFNSPRMRRLRVTETVRTTERLHQERQTWRLLCSTVQVFHGEVEHQECVTLNKGKHFDLLKTFRRQQSSCLRQVWCGLAARYGRMCVLSLCCLLQIRLKALNWAHRPEGNDSRCCVTPTH